MGLTINTVKNALWEPDESISCLKFYSDGVFEISFCDNYGTVQRRWNGDVFWSLDKKIWNKLDGVNAFTINTSTIYFCGINNTEVVNEHCSFHIGYNNVRCEGDVASLLNCFQVTSGVIPQVPERGYAYLFNGCGRLVGTAPSLSHRTLSNRCYMYMFGGCNISYPPSLPATSLAEGCYSYMFEYCSMLHSPPSLPASELADECYAGMFKNSGVFYSPELRATTLEERCYESMFESSRISEGPVLPATTVAPYCYHRMFFGCTGLTKAANVSALRYSVFQEGCFMSMYEGCSGIKYTLFDTYRENTLAYDCCRRMYANSGIEKVPNFNIADGSVVPYGAFREMLAGTKVKFSLTDDETYTFSWRIPAYGRVTNGGAALYGFIRDTAGRYTGDENGSINFNDFYYIVFVS